MLTVAVLGAVEVRRDGEILSLPKRKTTELLVRLALDAGSWVRADTLIEDLWAEPTGRNTLQSKVSQLRRALGDPALVKGSGDAYTLAIERSCVDAFRVVDLAVEASAARDAGEPEVALERASEGVGLFRDDVLVDAGDWASPHRTRLAELYLGLIEDLMAVRIELGSGAEIVGELETLVGQHPLRERLWASLVTALYRAGRQADALSAYTRVRAILIDQLGIEPGPELRALEEQVLQQSAALGGSSYLPPVVVPGNLPSLASPLVGRDADASTVASLLGEHRLVTVVGPAGVGKTRLAIEVARGLATTGGTWLVRLDAADASADLRQVVTETLHLHGGGEALLERLNGAETVLMLDNCEHLSESAGVLAQWLLDLAPRLRILSTSQVPLGVDAECVYYLQPLSADSSVALFANRAQATRRQFVLDAEARTRIGEICRSLDGLPLAIELAAARVRSLSLQEIARRLDDRFALLRNPSSHRPERSRALESAIAWSYELLFPDDQCGLWALSCFASDAPLEAVERVLVALGVPAAAVLDTITRLVDRSLVSADIGEAGSVRYRLLDSIRAYSADRLREAGQSHVAATAIAAWYGETAHWCDANVRGRLQRECLAVARAERANVDAVLAWCATNDPMLAGRIVNGFGWAWVVLGDGTAGAARVRAAMKGTTGRDRAAAHLIAGWLEASAGDIALAQSDLDSARAIAQSLDADLLLADVERHAAFLAIQQGRPMDVRVHAAASLATYQRLRLPWQTGASQILAGYGALLLGDTPTATRHATAAASTLAPTGDSWAMVHASALLAGIAQAEHRYADAVAALTRAAEESRHLGFLGQAALHLATLGRVQQRASNDEDAAVSFDLAIAAARASGDGRLAATARLNLSRLRRAIGNHTAALSLLEENERWYQAAGGGEGAMLNRCLLYAEREDGCSMEKLLEDATAAENHEVRIYALDALAYAAAAQGELQHAEQLLAQADSLAPSVAHLVDELDRIDKARARNLGL